MPTEDDPPGNAESPDEPDRRYPVPGGEGFADAALVAGRPFSSYLHLEALLAAAGADIGAFYQVIAVALNTTPGPLLYLVVIGFTTTVVYLAHVVGVVARNRKARARSTSSVVGRLCALVLIVLGAVAFLVRLLAPPTVGGGNRVFRPDGGVPAQAVAGHQQLISAVLFLALYLATVMVAAVGAYLTHNPLRESYAVAVRAHRRWSENAAVAQAAFIVAQSREMQTQSLLALTEELKQKARIQLLAAAKDPAVTDAYTKDDGRPYTPPPQAAQPNGSGDTKESG